MRLSHTVFEIISLIFQKLKRSRDSDHAPFRDNLSSEGWDLLATRGFVSDSWATCFPFFHFFCSVPGEKKENKVNLDIYDTVYQPRSGKHMWSHTSHSLSHTKFTNFIIYFLWNRPSSIKLIVYFITIQQAALPVYWVLSRWH